jgi:hypothetical protein
MKRIILGLIVSLASLSVLAAGGGKTTSVKSTTEKHDGEKTKIMAASDKNSGEKSTKKFSRPYGMAGCGLGSIVMGKHGSQVFAATTNGTGSNQFFGITFGTSNCVDGSENEVAGQSDLYIRGNRLAVQMDIARGSGESVAGLSQIMGCKDAQKFGKAMQKNYNVIFSSEKTVTNEITDSIITVIQNDEELVDSCRIG